MSQAREKMKRSEREGEDSARCRNKNRSRDVETEKGQSEDTKKGNMRAARSKETQEGR